MPKSTVFPGRRGSDLKLAHTKTVAAALTFVAPYLDPSVNGSVRRGSVLVSPIPVEPSVQVSSTIPTSSGAVRDVHRGETIRGFVR